MSFSGLVTMDGHPMTEAQVGDSSFYESIGFPMNAPSSPTSLSYWSTESGSPVLNFADFFFTTDFSSLSGNHGITYPPSHLMLQSTYEAIEYVFGFTWKIINGETYPFMHSSIEVSPPSSSGADDRLRISTPNGFGFLNLVDVTDESASPVRVMTTDGVKAIQKL